MGTGTRRWLRLDMIVPVVLVMIAIVVSLEPKIFGVEIKDRQIILGFFGFLAADALLERTGRLFRIERRLDELTRRTDGSVSAGEILRTRASFERMEVLVGAASRSVMIIGINLEGAVASLPALIDLASSGVRIRLLAMDPHGVALAPSAAMSGVSTEVRRQKIIQNLDLLRGEFTARLPGATLRQVDLQVVDQVLPVGATGIDTETRRGLLIVQHYLTATSAERAPLIKLSRNDDVLSVREFFDLQYKAHQRYWWRGENRYRLNPDVHTPFNGMVLRLAAKRKPGRALDLGAGEGADAIRLAKLGYQVDAVDLSPVACEKIERFARAARVSITIRNESVLTTTFTPAAYDVVLMNGSLHYIDDKLAVLAQADRASAPCALHAVSLFSTVTSLPAEHTAVPVFPDEEAGVVEQYYRNWRTHLRRHERDRPEGSHPGFAAHTHSHIKLIVTRSCDKTED